MAENENLTQLLGVQLTPRREWFAAVELRDGTLARASDVMTLQSRIQRGIFLFAQEVDATLQRLVEALIAQLITLKQAQDAFQAYMRGEIAAFQAELAAEIRATLADLEAKIEDIKAYVDTKVADLTRVVKAYCDERYDAALQDMKDYTDARYSAVEQVIKLAQRRTVTFEQSVEDSFDYNNEPNFDSKILTVVPHYRFYVHGYSYEVLFDGKAFMTETGHTCLVTCPQLGISQKDAGSYASEFLPKPRLILGENEALRANMKVNGGQWDWRLRVEGYYVPRPLWPLFEGP